MLFCGTTRVIFFLISGNNRVDVSWEVNSNSLEMKVLQSRYMTYQTCFFWKTQTTLYAISYYEQSLSSYSQIVSVHGTIPYRHRYGLLKTCITSTNNLAVYRYYNISVCSSSILQKMLEEIEYYFCPFT